MFKLERDNTTRLFFDNMVIGYRATGLKIEQLDSTEMLVTVIYGLKNKDFIDLDFHFIKDKVVTEYDDRIEITFKL